MKTRALHDIVVSVYEKDYLLAEQGNDAPKAPHHTSREGLVGLPVDNQASASHIAGFRKWHLEVRDKHLPLAKV